MVTDGKVFKVLSCKFFMRGRTEDYDEQVGKFRERFNRVVSPIASMLESYGLSETEIEGVMAPLVTMGRDLEIIKPECRDAYIQALRFEVPGFDQPGHRD